MFWKLVFPKVYEAKMILGGSTFGCMDLAVYDIGSHERNCSFNSLILQGQNLPGVLIYHKLCPL